MSCLNVYSVCVCVCSAHSVLTCACVCVMCVCVCVCSVCVCVQQSNCTGTSVFVQSGSVLCSNEGVSIHHSNTDCCGFKK